MQIKITYFFRKKLPIYHSIEELFESIQAKLPSNIEFTNFHLKQVGNGLYKMLVNCIDAAKNQGKINHITGDIHYINLFFNSKKTILTIHDVDSIKKKGIKGFITKLLWFKIPIWKSTYVSVISEFTKQQLMNYVNVAENKIVVIPDCVSPQIKPQKKIINSKYPTILQIGTNPNKNIERVIEAIKPIKCKFIIVGYRSQYYAKILTENKIEHEVYDTLTYNEIINLYEKSDIVTFVSTYEGFGMPILEANAIGRPIITSNISPMKEVAKDSALLVNPKEVNEIRAAIYSILSDEYLRNKLIENGFKNAEKYSAESVARQYTNLYEKLQSSLY